MNITLLLITLSAMSKKSTETETGDNNVAKLTTKTADGDVFTTSITKLTTFSGNGYALWNLKAMSIFKSTKDAFNESDGVKTLKDNDKNQEILLNIISDKLLTVIMEKLPDMKASQIWAFIEQKINKTTISAKSVAIQNLLEFDYSKRTMEHNETEMLRLDRLLKTSFNSESILISDLSSIIALLRIPSEYGAIRSILQEKDAKLSLEGIFSSLIREEATLPDTETPRAFRTNAITPNPDHKKHGNKFPESQCWRCHPELRPECQPCKTANKKFYHKNCTAAAANATVEG